MLPLLPSSTRSSASASCTTTRPRKRRRNSGGTSSPISRGAVRRSRPPATRIVIWATPSRSSSSTTAAIAACRGPCSADGIGSDGCSMTTVAVPPRVTSSSSGGPSSGKAQRFAHAGRDVVERFPRDGRPQNDVVVARLGDHDSRVGEERYARHVSSRGAPQPP